MPPVSSFASPRLLLMLVPLMLLLGLPVVLISAKSEKRAAIARVTEAAEALTGAVEETHDLRLQSARELLITLGQIAEVRKGDWPRVSELLADLVKAHPHYHELAVFGAEGAGLASSRASQTPTRPHGRREWEEAARTGGFALGAYQWDTTAQRVYLPCAMPAPERPGTPRAILYAAIRLEDLGERVPAAGLPEGTVQLVTDAGGLLLARIPPAPGGSDPSAGLAPLVEKMLVPGRGIVEVPGADGEPRVTALAHFSGGDGAKGRVAVAVPRGALYAGATRALVRNVVALLSGALLLFAVLFFGLLTRKPRQIGPAVPVPPEPTPAPVPVAVLPEATLPPIADTPQRTAQHQTRTIAMLNEMAEMLRQCSTVAEAYEVVGRFAQVFFPDLSGAVLVPCADGEKVSIVTQWGTESAPLRSEGWLCEDCLALVGEETVFVGDTAQAPLCRHLPEPPPGAYVCIPLKSDGEILGVLHVACPPGKGGPPDQGLPEFRRHLGKRLADHIALALHSLQTRERLRTESIHDALTGLYNRRHLEQRLAEEMHRAARKDRPLGLIILDVDHFKRFNDDHGHEAGDAMLRAIADFLRGHFRGSDVVCRFGGEEFVVILPEASPENALARAEGMREGVRRLTVKSRERELGQVTVSAGVAAFPEHGAAPTELIRSADEALYRAKGEGRDRVRTAVPPATAPRA